MLPGTAKTSRPCSAAKRAVISAPLRRGASTMTTALLNPLMMRLRGGKLLASGRVPSAYSLMTAPFCAIRAARSAIFGRVDLIDAAAQDGNRAVAGVQRCAVGDGVDAHRQAADDGHTGAGQLGRKLSGNLAAVYAGAACSDDGDRPEVVLTQVAAHVEYRRARLQRFQVGGIVVVPPRMHVNACVDDAAPFAVQVDFPARAQQILEAAPVEAGGRELLRRSAPSGFGRAEHIQQSRHASGSDAGNHVEADPVGCFVHVTQVHGTRVHGTR